jgi:hypothetical protein
MAFGLQVGASFILTSRVRRGGNVLGMVAASLPRRPPGLDIDAGFNPFIAARSR